MPVKQLRLNSLLNSRKTLARLIRELHQTKQTADIDLNKFKALVNSINVLLGYWKLEKDCRYEERIEELEKLMEARR